MPARGTVRTKPKPGAEEEPPPLIKGNLSLKISFWCWHQRTSKHKPRLGLRRETLGCPIFPRNPVQHHRGMPLSEGVLKSNHRPRYSGLCSDVPSNRRDFFQNCFQWKVVYGKKTRRFSELLAELFQNQNIHFDPTQHPHLLSRNFLKYEIGDFVLKSGF